ncbi:MAG: DUF4156 domain-containing protein [Minicystis sp.]
MRGTILFCTLLTGCAVTQLSPSGASVEVATAARPDCEFAGTIRASEGFNARTPETNMEAVQASLRNQAADRGANLIVITSQQLGTSGGAAYVPPGGGVVNGGCPNCISMMASVYRCGGGGGSVQVARRAPAAAPAAPASRPGEFPRKAAEAALAAAAESARSCKPAGTPGGNAVVKVTFATTGDVVFTDVIGAPYAGTPVADCIGRIFRNAHLPAFEGESVTTTRTLVFE